MKQWFRVSPTKIYDLRKFDCFWLEKINDQIIAYGGILPLDKDDIYLFNHFFSEEDAEEYINELYSILDHKMMS